MHTKKDFEWTRKNTNLMAVAIFVAIAVYGLAGLSVRENILVYTDYLDIKTKYETMDSDLQIFSDVLCDKKDENDFTYVFACTSGKSQDNIDKPPLLVVTISDRDYAEMTEMMVASLRRSIDDRESDIHIIIVTLDVESREYLKSKLTGDEIHLVPVDLVIGVLSPSMRDYYADIEMRKKWTPRSIAQLKYSIIHTLTYKQFPMIWMDTDSLVLGPFINENVRNISLAHMSLINRDYPDILVQSAVADSSFISPTDVEDMSKSFATSIIHVTPTANSLRFFEIIDVCMLRYPRIEPRNCQDIALRILEWDGSVFYDLNELCFWPMFCSGNCKLVVKYFDTVAVPNSQQYFTSQSVFHEENVSHFEQKTPNVLHFGYFKDSKTKLKRMNEFNGVKNEVIEN